VTFKYDALNRLTNMVDGVGTTLYAYTSGGQLLTEDSPFASNTVTNTSGCSSSPRACVPPANPSAPRLTTDDPLERTHKGVPTPTAAAGPLERPLQSLVVFSRTM